MVRHPKAIGDRSTMMIMLALREQGFDVYLPFGENTRCDLITDRDGRLSRVQCKTGRLIAGAVHFCPCSTYGHHRNPKIQRRSYIGEIDEFAVYCPATRAVYLIPIGDVQTRTSAALRVDPARNGQARKIRRAAAYEIAKIDVY